MSEFWWGLLWLTLFIPLMFLWGFALWDVFSRHDLRGWAKGLWAIAIVFFPIVGLLVYFLTRPKELDSFAGGYGAYSAYGNYGYGDPYAASYGYGRGYAYPSYRNGSPTGPDQYRPEQYGRASGPVPDPNDIETINRMHESGAITDEEYDTLKGRIDSQEPRAA